MTYQEIKKIFSPIVIEERNTTPQAADLLLKLGIAALIINKIEGKSNFYGENWDAKMRKYFDHKSEWINDRAQRY